MNTNFNSLNQFTLNSHRAATSLSFRNGEVIKCSSLHKIFHKIRPGHTEKITQAMRDVIDAINQGENFAPSTEEFLAVQRFNHLDRSQKLFRHMENLPFIGEVERVEADIEGITKEKMADIPKSQRPYRLRKGKHTHYHYNEKDLELNHGKEALRIFNSTQRERIKSAAGRAFEAIGRLFGKEVTRFQKYHYFLNQEDRNGDIYAHDSPLSDGDEATSYWIGHATCLMDVKVGNFKVQLLTDPVEGDLNKILYPRMTREARKLEECPAPQVYLLSHNHLDHYSPKTIKKLLKYQPIMIVPRGDAKKYRKLGFRNVYSHNWWQTTTIPFTKDGQTENLTISAVPSNHWSGTGPCDGHRSAFLGYVIHQEEGDIYFAGDTARLSRDHIDTLRERFNIRVQFQPGGPDEMRKDMETTHQASVDGLWMHFNLLLKGLYERGNFATKSKAEFMEAAKQLKTVYMHTKTFKLGNLHFDDTENSVNKVLDSLTERNPADLKPYEEQVRVELINMGLRMTFSGRSNLQPQDVQELLLECVDIPKIGERTAL